MKITGQYTRTCTGHENHVVQLYFNVGHNKNKNLLYTYSSGIKEKEFTVFVCLFHEVVHLCLGGVLPQGSQYRPQLLHRDRPIPVPIEHLKAFDKFYVERNRQKYKIELLNGFLWWHTFAIYMQDKLVVNVQNNNVNMRHIYVNLQHIYVDMQPNYVCLFVWGFSPTREFFTHLETSPLNVKGCKL